MAEFPAMPFMTDAYLGDTMHLSLEEHGAYLKLLFIAWRTPSCLLPKDDARIAIMLGITRGKWGKLKPTIMAFWTETEDGFEQKKLKKIREKVREKSDKNRESAERRWADKSLKDNKTSDANADANAMPDAVPKACERNANQNHNQNQKKKKPSVKKKKTALPEGFPNAKAKAAAKEYFRARGKPHLNVNDEAQAFRARCKRDGAVYLDWPAGWQTWYCNAVKWDRAKANTAGPELPEFQPRKQA